MSDDFYERDEDPDDLQQAFVTAAEHGITRSPMIPRRGSNSVKLKATHASKLDELFTGRTFDIVSEVHLPEDQVFHTVTGNRARHGYILKDRATGEQIAVGTYLLKIIHRKYLGVSLPPDRRKKIHRNKAKP